MRKNKLYLVLGIFGGIIISIVLICTFWPKLKYFVYNEKIIYFAPIYEKYYIYKNSNPKNKKLFYDKYNKSHSNNIKSVTDTSSDVQISNIDSILNNLYYSILESILKIEGYRYVDSITLDSIVRIMVLDSIETRLKDTSNIQIKKPNLKIED
jgi:hypothetical protein